jgi:hypothetical protein
MRGLSDISVTKLHDFPNPAKKEADCWAKGSQKHDFFVKLLEFT